MQLIISFLKDFKSRDGIDVFISSFLNKLIFFIVSIFIVRYISKEDFGYVTIALSSLSLFNAISGLGGNWSLLRFGSIELFFQNKFKLFNKLFTNGLFFNSLCLIIIIFSILFFDKNDYSPYILVISFGILTVFISEIIKSFYRVIEKNNIYSRFTVVHSLSILIFSVILTPLLKGIGYLMAITIAPIVPILIFSKKILKALSFKFHSLPKKYLSYGIYSGVGMIANDIIINGSPIIAKFLGFAPDEISILKVATIIPLNLIIIPSIVITTDFVHISKNSSNYFVLLDYYKKYFVSMFFISIIPFSALIIFHQEILIFIFTENYIESSNMFVSMIFAVFLTFLFRIPLGNILNAVGKANWNVAHSMIWFFLFTPVAYFLKIDYGINGVGYAISIVLVLSGFISLAMLIYYLKTIKIK